MAEDEREGVDQDSYYAILNVSKTATEDEIKRSYRQLAQICHPDKARDIVPTEGATSNFMRIQEAYEILSNEEKRNIYDIYGKEGLEAGLEIGPLRTQSELKEEYEKFKSQKRAEKEEASVAHRGVYSFKVDACEALNPYDSSVQHLPELISVATSNSVQLPLSDSTAASVGCQVAVRKRVGGGSFVCGVKRILTPEDTLECQAAIGLKTLVSATATRELGEHTSASITASWHREAGLGLSLSTSRQLTEHSLADLSWQVGPDSCMSLGFTRQGQKFLISGRIEAGASTGLVGKIIYQVTASISLRASAKLGTMGIELELGGSQRISNFSTAGCSVVAGVQGIVIRPKLSRGGHVFEVPVMLSPTVQDYHILVAAYVLPPLLSYATKYWIVLPLRRRSKVKKLLEERTQRVEELRTALEEAKAAAMVLEPVADRKLKKELGKDGLVIVSARYGAPEALRKAEQQEKKGHNNHADDESSSEAEETTDAQNHLPHRTASEEDESVAIAVAEAVKADSIDIPPPWMDVTVPVRFQVQDGRLTFHKGISKSRMMGFCDIALGEDKELFLYYLWRGKPYRATFTDRGGGSLPSEGIAVSRKEDQEYVRSLVTAQNLTLYA